MKSSLSSKGQVTIPKAIRDHLGLEPGNGVEFVITSEGTVLVRKHFDTAEPLRGRLRRYAPARPVTIEEMDEAIAREAGRLDREEGRAQP